jgi:methionyl aminopeptidase
MLFFNKPKLDDMREAAKIVSTVLLELAELTAPEVPLAMLDELANRRVKEMGGEPCLKGYKPDWAPTPFPASVCTSVDFEVCHGSPRDRSLKDGSIVKYDLAIKYKSGHGDACVTIPVGEIDNRKQRLLRYSLEAMYEGIKQVKAGQKISAIGNAIENSAVKNGYKIIAQFGGHTIGKELHEKPDIPNKYYKEDDEVLLKEGQIICIEPMVTPGKAQVNIWQEDKWTAYCLDRQPVAHFEHMVLVTKEGYEILTTWDN